MDALRENQREAADMLAGLAHKFEIDGTGRALREGGAIGLRYAKPVDVKWPRETSVSAECMAFSLEGLARMNTQLLREPRETHFAYVFCDGSARNEAAFNAAGYDYLYTSAVLVHDLDGVALRGAARCTIEEVTTAAQMDEINAIDPAWISHKEALGDPALIALCARDGEGRVRAKGDIILGTPHIAYVADMFTDPEARKQGFARAILSALHEGARKRGAAKAALLPSLMAHETGFYANCGYRRGCAEAVLLSKAPV